jgi:hypothetical protein
MAETGTEYKERLLRQLNSDAFLADREASFFTRELPFAETDAIKATLQDKIDVADGRREACAALAVAVENTEVLF